ncbi:MAG TPA: PIN domain-containing protein [Conexibacter sp.]
MLAIVDTGPLYASLDRDDDDHETCVATLQRQDLQLVIPVLVVAETSYLAGTRLGPDVEARFVDALATLDVEAPAPEDWRRISALVSEYGDFPLGTTDASVVALAERLDAEVVVTLDTRHFRAVRPRHRDALRLLPD